ncbi:MAG: MBL fold metallo-hydrolase [Candidatus Pacearchaeota archaeon]|nr:MBL fold metallo-hydrolase [Candidatus Pacearchaeota archaeon]
MRFKNLEIEKYGQSCFSIANGKKIYFDPYQVREDQADIILISHSHYDHCSIEDLKRIVKDGTIVICTADCQSKLTKLDKKIKMMILEPGKQAYIEGIKIKAVPAYTFNEYHPREENWNGYVVEVSGVKIYHAGDSDLIPEMGDLGKINIALLPVGGLYTMDAEQASQAAIKIKPEIAVPMHYGDIIGTKEDALRFQELCENEVEVQVLE